MIPHLDSVLQHLFKNKVLGLRDDPADLPSTVDDDQIGFRPPDNEWRNEVQRKSLNVYLVDLREKQELRSNERVRRVENGLVLQEPAPVRIDCHYLISAWSPATEQQGKTAEERQLLYEVTAALVQNESFVPRDVFAPNPLPQGFPDEIADLELPVTILPAEGFPKLAEFWGTMGADHRWKPVVYLIVTLPVVQRTEVAGPMVTTRITEYRRTGHPETAETWIQIGGRVLDATNPQADGSPAPVEGAWVEIVPDPQLKTRTQTTETDREGQFTFGGLLAGEHTLRARAAGLGERTRDILVPSPTGEYDLVFE